MLRYALIVHMHGDRLVAWWGRASQVRANGSNRSWQCNNGKLLDNTVAKTIIVSNDCSRRYEPSFSDPTDALYPQVGSTPTSLTSLGHHRRPCVCSVGLCQPHESNWHILDGATSQFVGSTTHFESDVPMGTLGHLHAKRHKKLA